MSTALFIYAHPDDESFGAAGTICLLRGQGWRVGLVVATRGDQGKSGELEVAGPEALAAVREGELREACRILDVSALRLLGYRDRQLADAPPDAIRRELVTIIRAERPSLVFTFDPNGFNAHPDHVAISRFTHDAIVAAADERWYPDAGAAHRIDELYWNAPVPPWQAVDPQVAVTPGVDVVLDVSAHWRRKAEALRAHRSQQLSTEKYFFSKPELERILGIELWRRAWPGPDAQPRTALSPTA